MRPVDRRGVIAGAAGLAATATVGRAASPPFALALADITVAKPLAVDYAGTLRRVAAMGYRIFGFRLASWNPADRSEPTPEDKARMVHDAGMTVGVVRLGVRGGDYNRQFEQANRIGATIVALTVAPVFIGPRGLGVTTRADFDAYLPQLAALGERARAAGLTLAYHNHWFDLTPLGGDRPLDVIARTIPPAILSFEVDFAWAWYAGVAPLDLLKKLGSRVVSMHWKDIDRARGTSITDHAVPVGSGEMEYAALLPRIRAITPATGYVEVDTPADGFEAARSAATFITRTLRARPHGGT